MNIIELEERVRIGARIRELRNEKNILQQDFADMCEISRSNLSKIESGKYGTSIDILARIAKNLGKTIDFV